MWRRVKRQALEQQKAEQVRSSSSALTRSSNALARSSNALAHVRTRSAEQWRLKAVKTNNLKSKVRDPYVILTDTQGSLSRDPYQLL